MDDLLKLMHDTMNKTASIIGSVSLLKSDHDIGREYDKKLLDIIEASAKDLKNVLDAYYIGNRNKWINAKDDANKPPKETRVIRYDSIVNSSQERMSVHITDSNTLKYADESTWWMLIPKLPVPFESNYYTRQKN